jgi:predicted RNA-binding protein with RPS1 domain
MKLIRQIVLLLAFISAFICLTVFSTVEYPADNPNLNATEDKLPLVKTFLANLDALLSLSDKVPVKVLPVTQIGDDYESRVIKEVYNKVNDTSDKTNITEKTTKQIFGETASSTAPIDLSNLFDKIKNALAKDWFRP